MYGTHSINQYSHPFCPPPTTQFPSNITQHLPIYTYPMNVRFLQIINEQLTFSQTNIYGTCNHAYTTNRHGDELSSSTAYSHKTMAIAKNWISFSPNYNAVTFPALWTNFYSIKLSLQEFLFRSNGNINSSRSSSNAAYRKENAKFLNI